MRRVWLATGICALLTACAGKAPPAAPADASGGSGGGGSDGSIDTGQNITGTAMDYFGAVPLPGTTIATDGVDPPVMATSAADGTYALGVPVGSKLYLLASRSSYRATRSMPLSMTDQPIMQDVYVMSETDVRNQYTTVGKTPTAGTAFLVATLENPDGSPLTGIPLTQVQLLDAQNQPVAGVLGPYLYGSAGTLDANATTTAAYGNTPSVRVAFLDVPPGTFNLAVTYPQPGGAGNAQNNTTVITAADGATLALSGGMMASTTSNTDPHFSTDIYPKLQRAADGGLGCANCHTAGGAGSVLTYDEAPDTVLTNMKAATGVIDLTTPANSLLVKNPLYPPTNHPNATFLDTSDPNYQLFLLWITNGAKP